MTTAAQIRQRLWSPPNAVPDPGIDLRREALGVRGPTIVPARKSAVRPKERPRRIRPSRGRPPGWPGNLCGEFWLPNPHDFWRALVPAGFYEIRSEVAKVFGVSETEINGPSRKSPVMIARHVTCALMKRLTPMSEAGIGREIGRRDHTSVRGAIANMAAIIAVVERNIPAGASAKVWVAAMKREIDWLDSDYQAIKALIKG